MSYLTPQVKGSTPSSFVHTSFFSVPAEKSSIRILEDASATQQMAHLQKMLQDALSSCARLADENVKLESENKSLTDKLRIMSEMVNVEASMDTIAVDATVGAIRGRVLEESRKENEELRIKIASLENKVRSLDHQLLLEQSSVRQMKNRLETLDEVEAISEARARAVERLDNDLMTLRGDIVHLEDENKALKLQKAKDEQDCLAMKEEIQRVREDLRRSEERHDRLSERIMNHGLQERVRRAQLNGPDDLSENAMRLLPASPSVSKFADHSAEKAALQKRISDLERQNSMLRNELSTGGKTANQSKVVEVLKDRLLQAVDELKLLSEDKIRERTYYNGVIAAYAGRVKMYESKLKKEMLNRRELKYYKFVAKKCQAELVAIRALARQPVSTPQ